MNEVDKLEEKKLKLLEEVNFIDLAIRTLQKHCEHRFVSDGHDSHYRYEKCTKCSQIDKI